MPRAKKPEGIEELVAPVEHPSIQEITMLDWYAGFALMGIGNETSNTVAVSMAFDRAELMMEERKKRL
jgi:hypothetical protein